MKSRETNYKNNIKTMKSLDKLVERVSLKGSTRLPNAQMISKKKMKTEANEIKEKMNKFLDKYKCKVQEVRKNNELLNFNLNFIHPEEGKPHPENAEEVSIRSSNKFILNKGLTKFSINKHEARPLTDREGGQKMLLKNQNPELHPLVHSIRNLKETISTKTSDTRRPPKFSFVELKDFKVCHKIGSGKYGEVYMVKHKKSGFMFALKKIQKSNVDQIGRRQLIHEIKIQLFINHPNVVKLYAYFSDSKYFYLVLELCTSGHLYKHLQNEKQLQEDHVQVIVKQICQGLLHLHDRNIIHRDVKLENILYQMGMVKIADFGWSIETEDLRETFCGTPLYVAPEILQQKGYDNKIDVWCVGILSFELLYGRVPFQIRDQLDFGKIVYDDVEFPTLPQVSRSGKEFISACLTKDPKYRPSFEQLCTFNFIKSCERLSPNTLY